MTTDPPATPPEPGEFTSPGGMKHPASGLDDHGLLAQIARGNLGFFQPFVDRYRGRLYAFLFHQIGDAHRAEDLLQEVFLKVVRAARAGHGPHNPDATAWVFTIARRSVIDYRRACAARPLRIVPDAQMLDGPHQTPPDGPMLQRESGRQLEAAVEQLPDAQREALVMRVFGGMSFRQIAEATTVPEGTAKSRVYYALAALRDALTADGEPTR